MMLPVASSWMPGGWETVGVEDLVLKLLWLICSGLVVLCFLVLADGEKRITFASLCFAGLLLSTPALAVPREFGITLPTLAFFAAFSVALLEVTRIVAAAAPRKAAATLSGLILVSLIALGSYAGARRSVFLAEALDGRSAIRAIRDGEFVYGLYGPASIPEQRRRQTKARLAEAGVLSKEDLMDLRKDPNLFVSTRRTILRIPKYEYLSF